MRTVSENPLPMPDGGVAQQRLEEIAVALGITVAEFWSVQDKPDTGAVASEGQMLLDAYFAIKSEVIRRHVLSLVMSLTSHEIVFLGRDLTESKTAIRVDLDGAAHSAANVTDGASAADTP